MIGIIIILGFLLGFLLMKVIDIISLNINYKEEKKKIGVYDYLIILSTCTVGLISFFKFGLSMLFIKALLLDYILIVVSFIDFKHEVIPNYLVKITALVGIVFAFFSDISFQNTIASMFIGGGVLFLVGIIPNAMGGGDIKWMFALGSFLGTQKVLVALFLAFMFAAVISILLVVFKIKGRKDYIPFGPFLAMGCFVSFHIIFLL